MIEPAHQRLSIAAQCRLLSLSRSSYYYAPVPGSEETLALMRVPIAQAYSGVRIHDLRHSFASHAAAHSETLPMIGKLLGHADVRTTTRYAHLDDRHVIEAAQHIGDLIEQSMSGIRSLNHNTKYDSGQLLHD